MLTHRVLQPGTRVQIIDRPIQVTLRVSTGTVARPDEWDDYYVILLDDPAIYHHADGHTSSLPEIVEHIDNLTILQPAT